jgi:L-aspartate oxidase
LLEAVVFGESAGRLASEAARTMPDDCRVVPIENRPLTPMDSSQMLLTVSSLFDIPDLRDALKSLLWRKAGVIRNEEGLQTALEDAQQWSSYVFARQFQTVEGWELQNMLTVARLILEAAVDRRETCGAHTRCD